MNSIAKIRQLVSEGKIPQTLAEKVLQPVDSLAAEWQTASTRPTVLPYCPPNGKAPPTPYTIVPADRYDGNTFRVPAGLVGSTAGSMHMGVNTDATMPHVASSAVALRAMQQVFAQMNNTDDDGGITLAEVLDTLAEKYPSFPPEQQRAFQAFVDCFFTPHRYGMLPIPTAGVVMGPVSPGNVPWAATVWNGDRFELLKVGPTQSAMGAFSALELLLSSMPDHGTWRSALQRSLADARSTIACRNVWSNLSPSSATVANREAFVEAAANPMTHLRGDVAVGFAKAVRSAPDSLEVAHALRSLVPTFAGSPDGGGIVGAAILTRLARFQHTQDVTLLLTIAGGSSKQGVNLANIAYKLLRQYFPGEITAARAQQAGLPQTAVDELLVGEWARAQGLQGVTEADLRFISLVLQQGKKEGMNGSQALARLAKGLPKDSATFRLTEANVEAVLNEIYPAALAEVRGQGYSRQDVREALLQKKRASGGRRRASGGDLGCDALTYVQKKMALEASAATLAQRTCLTPGAAYEISGVGETSLTAFVDVGSRGPGGTRRKERRTSNRGRGRQTYSLRIADKPASPGRWQAWFNDQPIFLTANASGNMIADNVTAASGTYCSLKIAPKPGGQLACTLEGQGRPFNVGAWKSGEGDYLSYQFSGLVKPSPNSAATLANGTYAICGTLWSQDHTEYVEGRYRNDNGWIQDKIGWRTVADAISTADSKIELEIVRALGPGAYDAKLNGTPFILTGDGQSFTGLAGGHYQFPANVYLGAEQADGTREARVTLSESIAGDGRFRACRTQTMVGSIKLKVQP